MSLPELTVLAAGYSPVKGTRFRHLTYSSVVLDAYGPVGDRAYCLVDVATRRVLKTVQNPSLLSVDARVSDGVLTVQLPAGESASAAPRVTGETITCDYWGRSVPLRLVDGTFDELFSDHLGFPVHFAAAPRGDIVYGDPISIVTTASLAHFDSPSPARFRPTFVVDTDTPFVENAWLGREFSIGTARIRIGAPIPRCAVIDHDPVTGIRDIPLLKTLVADPSTGGGGGPHFGVYAAVVDPGVVACCRPSG